MNPRCIPTRATVQSRGVDGLTKPMRNHVSGCDGCSHLIDEVGALNEALEDARIFEYTAPADLEQRVNASIGPWAVPDVEQTTRRAGRIAAAAALATAAATAVVSTAVIVFRHRHRAA